MEDLNLLDELLSALASLSLDLPADLVEVHLDLTGRYGCVPCRFRHGGSRVDLCGCKREAKQLGAEGLQGEPIFMTMTLVVQAVGRASDGLVFIAAGTDTDAFVRGAAPRPCIRVFGTGGGSDVVEANYPQGVLRRELIAAIFDAAIASGCSTIVPEGHGRYRRSDTGEALADCSFHTLFGV